MSENEQLSTGGIDPTEAWGLEKERMALRAKLAEKKCAVMKEVEKIPERGYNDFSKYKYPLAGDIVNAVRKSMAKNKLVVTCTEADRMIGHHVGAGNIGEVRHFRNVYRLIDAETGYYEETVKFSEAADGGDKSSTKNSTTAFKFWLVREFCIAYGDEIEADENTDRRAAGKGKPPASSQEKPRGGSTRAKSSETAKTDQKQGKTQEPQVPQETTIAEIAAAYDPKFNPPPYKSGAEEAYMMALCDHYTGICVDKNRIFNEKKLLWIIWQRIGKWVSDKETKKAVTERLPYTLVSDEPVPPPAPVNGSKTAVPAEAAGAAPGPGVKNKNGDNKPETAEQQEPQGSREEREP